MSSTEDITIQHLCEKDITLLRALLKVFSEAFDEPETYCHAPPTNDYLQKLLSQDDFYEN